MMGRTYGLALCIMLAALPATAQTAPDFADTVRASATAKFKAADANGDGFLDAAEIEAAASAHVNERKLQARHHRTLRRTILTADANRDRKVSLDEYVAWSMRNATRHARKR